MGKPLEVLDVDAGSHKYCPTIPCLGNGVCSWVCKHPVLRCSSLSGRVRAFCPCHRTQPADTQRLRPSLPGPLALLAGGDRPFGDTISLTWCWCVALGSGSDNARWAVHAAPSPVELVGCLVVGRAGWDLCRGVHGQGCAGSILVGSAWSVGGQGWEGRRRPGPLPAPVFVASSPCPSPGSCQGRRVP